MQLIDEVAARGFVGTEPHVLEEVELGYSETARLMADLLYTAEAREYARTGKLVCVSEGPLNRAPWFTYQGYQLDAEGDAAWVVKTKEDLPEYHTPDFRRSVALISTKAAFLWAAARPEPYSRTLLAYVRGRARTATLGYASGIFAATGLPTANYSDVNTNGIILEAIAYRLGGRMPLENATMTGRGLPTSKG